MEQTEKIWIEERIVDVLKTVYDPEIPVDIYELGLIYRIEVKDNNDVEIDMTLTAPNCPAADFIMEDVRQKVDALEEMLNSEIERSTNADSEINAHLQETDNAVAALTQSLSDSVSELNTTISEGLDAVNISISTAVSTLNQSIDAERNERTAKDEEFDGRLNAEEQARTEKDDELSERISAIEGGQGDISGKILTQEGTEYDPTTGRLMLKSRDGSNDVEVQFSFNFGTF